MITRYIQVYDDVLSSSKFEKIKETTDKTVFHEEIHGEDSFTVSHDRRFNTILHSILEGCLNRKVKLYLGFLRLANQDIDTRKRIHSDAMMQGHFACVYYINTGNQITGTRFYKHSKYGYKLPRNLPSVEMNRVLCTESDKNSMWNKDITIKGRPNRLLIYESDLFHAKFPSKCEDKRIIWVGFFDM